MSSENSEQVAPTAAPRDLQTTHRLRPWARAATVAVVLYWLAMFAGTHDPHPPAMPTEHFDKVLHCTGFGGLAVLIAAAWSLRKPMTFMQYLVVISGIAVYAALDEITQMLVPNRSCEFLDWCADVTGGVLGLVFAAIVMHLLRRHWSARTAR